VYSLRSNSLWIPPFGDFISRNFPAEFPLETLVYNFKRPPLQNISFGAFKTRGEFLQSPLGQKKWSWLNPVPPLVPLAFETLDPILPLLWPLVN